MPSRYRVLDRAAPRRTADPGIGRLAELIRTEVASETPHGPTGRLARGWRLAPGRVTAVRLLRNDVPYARFVEYGTRRKSGRIIRANPVLGRTMARYRQAFGRGSVMGRRI